MKLEQSFEVAAPLEKVWEALVDVERTSPCLPGASLSGRNEDGSFNGEFKVKIGPTSAAYHGKLTLETVDADAHTTTMQASGTDRRGQGNAKSTIVSTVTSATADHTKVVVSTDYQITGRLARFGRGGAIEEISERLLAEFATNLQALLDGGEGAESAGGEEPAAVMVPTPAVEPEPEPAAPEPEPEPEPEPAAVEPEAAEPAPAADPDAAIGGATPVAEPAAEPEPTPAGPVVLRRVKDNPVPFVALVCGFVLALRVLRRRS